MLKIAKTLRFEAAHVLSHSYTEKCMNIHGHSFVATFEIFGDLNKDGVVLDFTLVKELMGDVIEQLDHSLIIKRNTALSDEIVKLANNFSLKLNLFTHEPTAENLSVYLAHKLAGKLFSYPLSGEYDNVNKIRVSINETCTSAACFDLDAKSWAESKYKGSIVYLKLKIGE